MKSLLIPAGLLLLIAGIAHSQETGNDVVVIYNTRVAESRDVALHYAQVRHVPANQVLGFDLTDSEVVSRTGFQDRLQAPLIEALAQRKLIDLRPPVPAMPGASAEMTNAVVRSSIRYAVLCYGIPLKIAGDTELREPGADRVPLDFRRNDAAVDSELACLPYLAGAMPLTGPTPNLLYGCTNADSFSLTNGLLMVARLDGPTAAIARGLVDKAVVAEAQGLWGRAYFDLRGLTNGPYRLGDSEIGSAAEICRRLGFETVVDDRPATFPAGFPLSQVALYAGWYDEHVSGPFAGATVEFMPGAFAYHLHSFSAASLRTTDRFWAGPLLARGATATMGCVAEPYLELTPDMAVFFDDFVNLGMTYGEAAYACQRGLSWQTTVIGDPLYRPFDPASAERQRQDLENRRSSLLSWVYLREINQRLAAGGSLQDEINSLENLAITRQSAVLTEKLADLCFEDGQAGASVENLRQALKLDPSPQQRIRVTLTLGARLAALGREKESYDVFREFLDQSPDYPGRIGVLRELRELALKLGQNSDAQQFESQIARLAPITGSQTN